jgi:hypothetical protein
VGWLTLEDAESGEQVELNTSDPAIRRGYADLAADRHHRLRRAIRSAGLDLLDLSTDQPCMPPLLQFFKSRQRRQR